MHSCKTLLVGCGTVSRFFYQPALAEAVRESKAKIVGVVDPDQSTRNDIATKLSCTPLSSLEEGLNKEPDIAILATPPAYHCSQTIKCFLHGCDVLCEKPLASSAIEAQEMIVESKKNNRMLAVGHYKRFLPAAQEIKSIIQNQTFGKLLRVNLQEGGKFNWPIKNDAFFNKKKTPGGVLFDIGIHALDLLIGWLGQPAIDSYEDDCQGGLEANAKLKLSWPGIGCQARLFFSRDWQTSNEWTFEFRHARIHWAVNDAQCFTLSLPGKHEYDLKCKLLKKSKYDCDTHAQSFTRHLFHVLDARENRQPLMTSVDDAMTSLNVIEDCYSMRHST